MKAISLDPRELEVRAERCELTTWQGRSALCLENGLALIHSLEMESGSIELSIGADGAAYPGVAFHVSDARNHELAYPVPHCSGQWDAIQYDPVFHGSNTWQLYYGPAYQQSAQIPAGSWFRFRVDFRDGRAAVSVDDQPPLVVEQLAHGSSRGQIGLWTFRPAYFADLHVDASRELGLPVGSPPSRADGAIDAWLLEGYGVVRSEPNGVVNLNRHLPVSTEEACLTRRFELQEKGEIEIQAGFSDLLALELDGETIFEGEHTFKGFDDRTTRGYAELDARSVRRTLKAGIQTLVAKLGVQEGFGWGLIVTARAEGLHWLPVESG